MQLILLAVYVWGLAGSSADNTRSSAAHADGHELQTGEEHCPGCMDTLELLAKMEYTQERNVDQSSQRFAERSSRQPADQSTYEPSYFIGDSVSRALLLTPRGCFPSQCCISKVHRKHKKAFFREVFRTLASDMTA